MPGRRRAGAIRRLEITILGGETKPDNQRKDRNHDCARLPPTVLDGAWAPTTAHAQQLRLISVPTRSRIVRHEIALDVERLGIPATRRVDEAGDIAAQIEERVQLDGGLGLAEARLWKHRQTQVDGAGVQRVDGIVQFHRKAVLRIERSRGVDQAQCEVLVDPPVPLLVGIGQSTALNAAANPQVIELGRVGPQAGFDVAQALPERQLRERHAQELIEVGNAECWIPAGVLGNSASERMQRHMIHQLGEHQLPRMHNSAPGQIRQHYAS
jgi:hypothetical protein